jgi:cysteine desulfuration protein SufE
MRSIEESVREIQEVFCFFEDPMQKIEQLIDYGKMASGISEDLKIDDNRIVGCTSMAWVVCSKDSEKIFISTDSESYIVKGLLHLLEKILNGRAEDEILSIRGDIILKDIGLGNNITSQRTNGFLSAVNKIQTAIQKT